MGTKLLSGESRKSELRASEWDTSPLKARRYGSVFKRQGGVTSLEDITMEEIEPVCIRICVKVT